MVIFKIRKTSWIVIVLKNNIQIVIQKDIQLDKMLDNFNRALRGRLNEISRILYLTSSVNKGNKIKYILFERGIFLLYFSSILCIYMVTLLFTIILNKKPV